MVQVQSEYGPFLSARARSGETQSHPFHVTNRRSLAGRPKELEKERGREGSGFPENKTNRWPTAAATAAIIIKLRREIYPERRRRDGEAEEGGRNILEMEQGL